MNRTGQTMLLGIMLSVYLGLCFAGWIMETIDNTTWRWKK